MDLLKTLTLRTLVLALCLVLFSCGGDDNDDNEKFTSSACETIGLPNKSLKIINGESCDSIDTAPILRVAAVLETEQGLVASPICTGTLISQNKVLTAAHCVNISEIEGNPVRGFAIIVGEPESAKVIRADAWSTPEGIALNADKRLVRDIAVIRTAEPVSGINPLPLLASSSVNSQEVGYVYGYGRRQEGTEDGQGDDFFTLEGGAMTVESVTEEFISVIFDGRGTNVCNGDSGGPLIVVRNNEPAIAGVVSQGSTEGCRAGDLTTFTNINLTAVREWLNQVAGEARRV